MHTHTNKIKSESISVNASFFFKRDTAGQERFRTLTTAYYRGAMGILLMYDVTSLESFNHLSYWLRNIQEVRLKSILKIERCANGNKFTLYYFLSAF